MQRTWAIIIYVNNIKCSSHSRKVFGKPIYKLSSKLSQVSDSIPKELQANAKSCQWGGHLS